MKYIVRTDYKGIREYIIEANSKEEAKLEIYKENTIAILDEEISEQVFLINEYKEKD